MPQSVLPLKDVRRGRLVAREYVSGRGWRCVCDCGGERYAHSSDYDRGSHTSCGCLRKDRGRARRKFDHDEATALVANGATRAETARQLGVTTNAICVVMKAAGVQTDYYRELNHHYFASIDTEAKAYWLGFLAADGNVGDQNKISLKLAVKDRGHVEAFRTAVGSTHALTECVKKRSGGIGKRGDRAVGVSFRSDEMTADLARLGIVPRKSLTVEAWDGPAELMRHYWRGVIDGDGWVCTGQHACVGLIGSAAMVKAFHIYGQRLTGAKAKPKQKGKVWQMQFGASGGRVVARHLYTGAAVFLARKKAKADQLLSQAFRYLRDLSQYTREQLVSLYAEHQSWRTVAAILCIPRISLSLLRERHHIA